MKALLTAFIVIANSSLAAGTSDRIIHPLDTGWKFYKGDVASAQNVDFDDSTWRTVTVPHDWSIEGPYSDQWASSTGYLPGGIGWYRYPFTLAATDKDKSVFIEFDGVYRDSEVWFNGKSLGKRPYGYSSFQYELTPYIKFDGVNTLAVRVDHTEFADSRWYTGSGIYRPVRLIIKDKLHIAHWGVFVTTPKITPKDAEIRIQTEIENQSSADHSFELITEILSPENLSVVTITTASIIEASQKLTPTQTVKIADPQLWSVDSPALYRLVSKIKINGKTVDSQETPFGIREFRFDADKGFFLNGKNIKIKGVCVHHDAGSVGAAVPAQMWQRRFRLLKEIGCNAIRTSHNPPDPQLLDLCDQMGFVVMDEAFDEFTPPKRKWVSGWNDGTPSLHGYGEVFAEWCITDISDMIRRDRNHPSIILWSIGNEIDYANDPFSHPVLGDKYDSKRPSAENLVKWGKPLVETVKKLDSTRPVTSALATAPMSNAVGFADLLDVVGYNYQEQYYADDHKKYPKRILLGSENGMGLEAWKAVTDNDYIAGQFLWLGFDFIGESRQWPMRNSQAGLFDTCGFKKFIGFARQALWNDKPMVYLSVAPARPEQPRDGRGPRAFMSSWNWPDNSNVNVFPITNCQKVELFLNDKSLGTKSMADTQRGWLMWPVPYTAGTLKAVGINNDKAVCEYILQTTGPAKKIALKLDSASHYPGTKDTFQFEVTVTDDEGMLVSEADNEITLTIDGPARLLGFGNGDAACHNNETDTIHKVYQGRALAIIQSTGVSGKITVKAAAAGLTNEAVVIDEKAGQ